MWSGTCVHPLSVLLVALALVVSLGLGAPGPVSTPVPLAPPLSRLPATRPGLSDDEGVFLFTAADDGSTGIYFVAQNVRHSILRSDLDFELRLNPLWPERLEASREEVLAFPEATPIGAARAGLLSAAVAEEPVPAAADAAATDALAEGRDTDAHDVDGGVAALDPPIGAVAYTVRAGDTLTRLSARQGTTVQAILEANGIGNPNLVYAGRTISIPGPASAEPVAGDQATVGADQAVVAEDQAGVADEPDPPATGEDAAAEPLADVPTEAEALTYTVKRGESAMSISRLFGVDVEALLAVNGVKNRNHVEAGQVLTIPAG